MFSDNLIQTASRFISAASSLSFRIATAESCTGGLLAGLLTEIPGSSTAVDRGYVTYSNEAKIDMLGVAPTLIAEFGAVSEPVARAMAEGGAAHITGTGPALCLAITGVAGPGGGTEEKPVGLVHIAVHARGGETRHEEHRFGDLGRHAIRLATLTEALALAEESLEPYRTS